jgi:hypothetical protein
MPESVSPRGFELLHAVFSHIKKESFEDLESIGKCFSDSDDVKNMTITHAIHMTYVSAIFWNGAM